MEDLIMLAFEMCASDIHLSTDNFPALRVNGELIYIEDYGKLSRIKIEKIIFGILTEKQREKFLRSGDLDFAFNFENQRFRVNAYREMRGMSAAFRLVPSESLSLDELALPEILKTIATKRRGLFLATGPTGHGKSSTLAAIIKEINQTRKLHIVTIEDPIEFIHFPAKSLIHQREIGKDTENFSSGIRHVLRQDPDVIMIGEMRDLETISAAITAAETGHLVFGTLHTQDAPQSVERIIDVFPPHQQNQIRLQLAYSLLGVCSQQLVPTADKKSRVCATEILITTSAIRAAIREGKTSSIRNAILTGKNFGMHTMEQDLARLFHEGKITRQSANDYAYDLTEIERLLK